MLLRLGIHRLQTSTSLTVVGPTRRPICFQRYNVNVFRELREGVGEAWHKPFFVYSVLDLRVVLNVVELLAIIPKVCTIGRQSYISRHLIAVVSCLEHARVRVSIIRTQLLTMW